METVTYKCPNCDAGLVFSPEKQSFVCEYCRSVFSEAELEKVEQGSTAADSPQAVPSGADTGDAFTVHAALYTCANCGAEVVVDDTTAATQCFYCHNPVVLSGKLSGDYRPQSIVPFALEKDEVKKHFADFCRKKHFLRREFRTEAQAQELTGVYLPYWLINSRLAAKMDADGTKIRVWKVGDTEYTETKRYHIRREGYVEFQDFSAAAFSKRTMELARGVLPFDMDKRKAFSMPYLSGFQAEKRSVERAELQSRVHEEMGREVGRLLDNSIHGYTTVRRDDLQTSVTQEDWNHTLLPVWLMTYQFREKLYYFAMNGQTGKICGSLPVSVPKLAALFFGVAVGIFALFLLIGGALL